MTTLIRMHVCYYCLEGGRGVVKIFFLRFKEIKAKNPCLFVTLFRLKNYHFKGGGGYPVSMEGFYFYPLNFNDMINDKKNWMVHLETKRIVRKTAITYIITRRQNHIFKGYARDLRLGDVSGPDGAEPPRRLEAPRPLRSKPRTVHVILDYRSLSYIVHYSSFSP